MVATSTFNKIGSWFRTRKLEVEDNRPSPQEQRVIDEFSSKLDEIENKYPMINGYQRIDPYVIRCSQSGINYKLIIYHVESKAWFDNQNVDAAIAYSHEAGLVRPGAVVFDLGCNSGFLTSWFALRVGPKGKVVAFDPFPWNTLASEYSAKLNGCYNVECHTVGIAGETSQLNISLCDSKIYENPHAARDLVYPASLVPLDNYAGDKPDYIKVDIEGAERDLLRGASKILHQAKKPFWFLEIHHEFIEEAGADPSQICRDFIAAGYRCHIGHPRGEAFSEGRGLPRGCGLFCLPNN